MLWTRVDFCPFPLSMTCSVVLDDDWSSIDVDWRQRNLLRFHHRWRWNWEAPWSRSVSNWTKQNSHHEIAGCVDRWQKPTSWWIGNESGRGWFSVAARHINEALDLVNERNSSLTGWGGLLFEGSNRFLRTDGGRIGYNFDVLIFITVDFHCI